MGYSNPQSGMGCSCGGQCGDTGVQNGLGQIDFSNWGWQQYSLLLLGGYLVISAWEDVTSDTVKKGYRKTKRAASTAASGAGSVVKYALIAGAAFGVYYFWNQYQTTGSIQLPSLPGLSGFGDYQQQGYVNPQILQNPTRNSQVQVPIGWAA